MFFKGSLGEVTWSKYNPKASPRIPPEADGIKLAAEETLEAPEPRTPSRPGAELRAPYKEHEHQCVCVCMWRAGHVWNQQEVESFINFCIIDRLPSQTALKCVFLQLRLMIVRMTADYFSHTMAFSLAPPSGQNAELHTHTHTRKTSKIKTVKSSNTPHLTRAARNR